MSTVIYHGFFVSTDSAITLMNLVNDFRPYVHAEGQKMLDKFIRATGGKDVSKGWRAWKDMRAETVDKGFRAPSLDTDFKLTFFPEKERFLGIAFTEHEAWFRRWLHQPLVHEYGYWNNSDKPRRIRQNEWNQRQETWDRVLDMDAPACRGLTITLHEMGGPLPKSYRKHTKRTK